MRGTKRLVLAGWVVLLSVFMISPPVFAESILEKVERTGAITVGYRDEGVPFGYIDAQGKWGGFDMDLGDALIAKLEEKLGKKISYNKIHVNVKTRLDAVAQGKADIVLAGTTITLSREEKVDFSLPYFLTGAKLLVPKGSSIRSFDDLSGKRVGTCKGCTAHVIPMKKAVEEKRLSAPCKMILFEDHPAGFVGLREGKIDAYFTDESLLAGMRTKAKNPENWEIVGEFITYEPYGFILPENDSAWKDFVNEALIELIKSGEFEAIYEKWFGPQGVVVYPMSTEYRTMLNILSFPK